MDRDSNEPAVEGPPDAAPADGSPPGPGLPAELLYAAALFALSVRLIGLNGGLPHVFHPDEPFIVDRARLMLRTGSPDPDWYIYPDLILYLNTALGAFVQSVAGHFEGLYPGGRCIYVNEALGGLYQLGRFATALFGIGTVLLTAATARVLGGTRAGILAGLALALSPAHTEHSHYLTTDVPAGFFIAATMYAAVTDRGVLAGIAAGLAAATKYNAGLVILLPLGLALARGTGVRGTARILIPCAVTFVLAMPWIVLNPSGVLGALAQTSKTYRSEFIGIDGQFNWIWYLKVLALESPLLVLGAAIGWRDRWREDRGTTAALLAYPVVYWLLLGNLRIRVFRNFVPVLPVLLVGLSGIGRRLDALPSRLRVTLLTVALSVPAVGSGLWVRDRVRTDTRARAFEWLNQTMPRGTPALSEHYCPPLLPTHFRVGFAPNLSDLDTDTLEASPARIVVASSYCFQRYFDEPERAPQAVARYRNLFDHWEVAARFEPDDSSSGPVIVVFRRPAP